VTLNGAGNISSIERFGTAGFKINFIIRMPGANYAWAQHGYRTGGGAASLHNNGTAQTETDVTVFAGSGGSTVQAPPSAAIVVFHG
jgi:hypothetical protein